MAKKTVRTHERLNMPFHITTRALVRSDTDGGSAGESMSTTKWENQVVLAQHDTLNETALRALKSVDPYLLIHVKRSDKPL